MIFCSEFPVSKCQKFLWGNPLVFQKKSGMDEMYEEEGVSRFSVKIFLTHITKNFVVEHFVFTKLWCGIKFSIGGEYHVFLSENFYPKKPKIIVRNPSLFQKN